jgi:hypothetical protein
MNTLREVARQALEEPEQELKPFNGLTKEEALAWARGLRIDSPPQPEKDWKALYHAQVQITEAAQRRANYTLELMNSMLEKQEQTEPTMTESTIPDGPTIPDGRWIVEVSSRVLKAWPISEQDAMQIAFGQRRRGGAPAECSNTFACRCSKHFTNLSNREWQDLTDDEVIDLVREECVDMRWPSTALNIARILADKLKEKNHYE